MNMTKTASSMQVGANQTMYKSLCVCCFFFFFFFFQFTGTGEKQSSPRKQKPSNYWQYNYCFLVVFLDAVQPLSVYTWGFSPNNINIIMYSFQYFIEKQVHIFIYVLGKQIV